MNYRLNKGCKYAMVNADYYLCTSDEQGEFVLGTPQCWDDAISLKIDFEQYDIYHIYSYTLEKSKVSRITDYKGIWGLTDLPRGTYSTYYDIRDVRVYIGVRIGHGVTDFKNNNASLEMLLPKHLQIGDAQIVGMIFDNFSNLLTAPSLQSLLKLQSKLPNSLLLFYGFQPDAQLVIVGEKAEMLFEKSDCYEWEKRDANPCYHHPWPYEFIEKDTK